MNTSHEPVFVVLLLNHLFFVLFIKLTEISISNSKIF